jgi:hypothetical protein
MRIGLLVGVAPTSPSDNAGALFFELQEHNALHPIQPKAYYEVEEEGSRACNRNEKP